MLAVCMVCMYRTTVCTTVCMTVCMVCMDLQGFPSKNHSYGCLASAFIGFSVKKESTHIDTSVWIHSFAHARTHACTYACVHRYGRGTHGWSYVTRNRICDGNRFCDGTARNPAVEPAHGSPDLYVQDGACTATSDRVSASVLTENPMSAGRGSHHYDV